MKKFYNKHKKDIPLYVSILVLIAVLVLWFYPDWFNLIDEKYNIVQYRSDLKELANLFYIVIGLWLVLVTRNMAQISINSQKAFNRPEILCEVFISDEKPSNEHFTAIKNVEIRNTTDSEYSEEQLGASVFLVVKNRYGGGKAIDINLKANFEAKNPDRISLNRNIKIDYLAEGDCIAFYLYRFEKPSTENCFLKLSDAVLQFTTPFNEASNDSPIELKYNDKNEVLAIGNHIGAIKLETGLRTNK